MRTRREKLRHTRSLEPCLGRTHGRAQARTTSTDDDDVVFVVDDRVLGVGGGGDFALGGDAGDGGEAGGRGVEAALFGKRRGGR